MPKVLFTFLSTFQVGRCLHCLHPGSDLQTCRSEACGRACETFTRVSTRCLHRVYVHGPGQTCSGWGIARSPAVVVAQPRTCSAGTRALFVSSFTNSACLLSSHACDHTCLCGFLARNQVGKYSFGKREREKEKELKGSKRNQRFRLGQVRTVGGAVTCIPSSCAP